MSALFLRCLVLSVATGTFLSAGTATAEGKKPISSLCVAPGQETLFACQAGSKAISVCYAPSSGNTGAELTYLYGATGKPAEQALHGRPATVKLSENIGNSGREFSLAFLNGTFAYVVYQGDDKYDMPMNASGVVVKNNGKQISWLGCTSDNNTAEMIWDLDSRPDLVDMSGSDSTTATNIHLPGEATTPCGWLSKANFKKYCNY